MKPLNHLSPELAEGHTPSAIAAMRRADPKFDAIMAQLISIRQTRRKPANDKPAESEPGWLLESALLATRRSDIEMYFVELKDGKITGRDATITWNPITSRMLFDGEDIETEDFMGYVGLTDQIVEGQDVGEYWVQTGAADYNEEWPMSAPGSGDKS